MGMISMVILNLTDGALVGHGAGSDALAAVNIVAPVYLLSGGICLMFGMGASVVASVHMSRNKQKAANINITQALIGAACMSVLMSTLLLLFPEEACTLFGSSQRLLSLATSYLFWIALFLPLGTMASVGMFLIRLDGNPKLAMWILTGSAISNMFFDWLLIFPMQMGIEGAAIATGGSFAVGGLVTMTYIVWFTRKLSLCRIKLSVRSMQLTLRNIGYQMRLGSSAFFGDVAIAFVIIIGNYIFMQQLGEDGVAAFSLACYCFPVVFSVGNAIVVSAQPLISFAYGKGDTQRMNQATRVAFIYALMAGAGGVIVMSLGAGLISSLFLPSDCHAWKLACHGLPLFGTGFIFIALNLAVVGALQSTERARLASVITMLRGYILLAAAFAILPSVMGVNGTWLAMPAAEALTLAFAGGKLISKG